MAQKKQFMIRLPEKAIDRLSDIAQEHGFEDGRGRHGEGNLNLAEAARYLLGQADEQLFDILTNDN
jgi:hypothetical protein